MGRIRSEGGWGGEAPRRKRWPLVAAIAVLAVADAASSDSAGEPGTPRPPVVAIADPGHLAVVAEPSFEVVGNFDGQVDRIEVLVDGQSLGRALPDDDAGRWRLPAASVSLAPGAHEIRATATGAAGSATDVVRIVHQPAGPGYAITLAPQASTLRPSEPGRDRVELDVVVYGGRATPELVLTANATPGGLVVEVAPQMVRAPGSAVVSVAADAAAAGAYEVAVRATSSGGGGPQQATSVVTVERSPPPTTTSTATTSTSSTTTTTAPATARPPVRYEVQSIVTAADVGGVANEGQATWALTWPCADGRCDGRVEDGGPRGRIAFDVTYDAASESYTFDFMLPSPENANCPSSNITGSIAPTGWDAAGPVGFTYLLDSVLLCDSGDLHVSWEGAGTRSS